jgi:hypothetical protein
MSCLKTDVSFLVFCDSSRQENLFQTLRFLIKREPGLMNRSEIIVVCQDEIPHPPFPVRLINLRLSCFNKPMMVNRGVENAQGEVIVILDGDRILPFEYFTNTLAIFDTGKVFCPRTLYKMDKTCSDDEIELRKFNLIADFRLPEAVPGRKNAFSGMALMGRNDYWHAGGMDETLVGYGCSDTDFTMTCLKKGLDIVYTEDEELHLWHKVNMSYNNFFVTNLKSVCRFCKKWNIEVPDVFKTRLRNHLMM